MKLHLKDRLIRNLILLTISLLITSGYFSITLITGISSQSTSIILVLAIGFIYWLFVRYPEYILFGRLSVYKPSIQDLETMREVWDKFQGSKSLDFNVRVVKDQGFVTGFFAKHNSLVLVLSSGLLERLNRVDLESLFAYLIEFKSVCMPARDTTILLLATVLRKVMITTFLGAALVHLVRPMIHDEEIDSKAVLSTKYAIGYRKMLEKLKEGDSLNTLITPVFSMQAVSNVNAGTTSREDRWFHVHHSLDKRIEHVLHVGGNEALH